MPAAKSPDQLIASGPSGNDIPSRDVGFEPIPLKTGADATTPSADATQTPKADTQGKETDHSVGDILSAFDKIHNKVPVERIESAPKADDKTGKEVKDAVPAADKGQEREAAKPVVDPNAPAPLEVKLPPTARTATDATQQQAQEPFVPEDILKNMSPHARDWAKAQVKRIGELVNEVKTTKESVKARAEDSLPDNYYEHPASYVLMPEYQQSIRAGNEMLGYLHHYQEQLLRVREGEEWEDLVQSKDGAVTKRPGQKPNERAQLMLEERISIARQTLRDEEVYQSQVIAQHQQKHVAVKSSIKQLEDRYFPQFKEKIVSSNGEVVKFVETAANDLNVLQQMHNPLSPMLLKLYTMFLETMFENQSLKSGAGAQQAQQQAVIQRSTGPTQSAINNGGNSKQPLDLDEVPFDPSKFSMR